MRDTKKLALLIGTVLIFLGDIGILFAGNCPPKNIKQYALPRKPNADGESIVFSYRSKTYPVDIFSAFDNSAGGATNICIRYEAINNADDPVEKFYWPLAGFEMDTFAPRKPVSLAITKPPGHDPTIDETWVYAFLRAAVKTYAFQKRHAARLPLLETRLASNDLGSKPKTRSDLEFRLTALDSIEQRLPLKEKIEFSEVAARFSGGDEAEVSSLSLASWNGEQIQIQIKVGRSSEKTRVSAPITYALAKAGDVSDFLGLVSDFTTKGGGDLPFDKDNSFQVSRKLSPRDFGNTQALYVIEQPVYFTTSDGNICFLSPMYSPIPLPAESLRCRLF